MKQKVTRQYIDHLLSNVSIFDYMESEYDSYFITPGHSEWANTNCPLPNHDDTSPSFGVHKTNNKYNCFGCGATGDIVSLVQNVEGLSFIESIQKLSVFAGLEIETVNLDIKYIIRELSSSIKEYLSKENTSDYPGGLSEHAFLIAFAERTKKHERKSKYVASETSWTEEIYKKIEADIQNQNFKNLSKIWNSFAKESRERIQSLNGQHQSQ
jgi:hypothetical protein